MTMPTTLPDALAMLGALLRDPNLSLGLVTVAIVLVFAAALAWLLAPVRR